MIVYLNKMSYILIRDAIGMCYKNLSSRSSRNFISYSYSFIKSYGYKKRYSRSFWNRSII